jgi:hypothetical protein
VIAGCRPSMPATGIASLKIRTTTCWAISSRPPRPMPSGCWRRRCRDLHPPPDHGQRAALHHAGAGRAGDPHPERRRPRAGDRAAADLRGLRGAVLEAAGRWRAAAALAEIDLAAGSPTLASEGDWCAPEGRRQPRLRGRRRPPSGGRAALRAGGGLRRQRLRRSRPRARARDLAGDRAEHGRQVDLPAPERADRGAGAGRQPSCRPRRPGSGW